MEFEAQLDTPSPYPNGFSTKPGFLAANIVARLFHDWLPLIAEGAYNKMIAIIRPI
jgi:hypothetical protein